MKEVVVGEGEDGFERWCLGIGKEKKVQIRPGVCTVLRRQGARRAAWCRAVSG